MTKVPGFQVPTFKVQSAFESSRVKRHADFLGLLYLAWGASSRSSGLPGSRWPVGRWPSRAAVVRFRSGSDLAAGLTAFTFGIIAVLALLLGVLHLWLGAALRRYRPWARLLALGWP